MRLRLTFEDRIGDLIAEKKEQGVTEAAMAGSIRIRPSALAQYKNGDRTPNHEILIRIADYFDVSIDYLVGRSDYKKDSIRYSSVEDLGLSETSAKNLQEIMNNEVYSRQMDKLLSSVYLRGMLRAAHDHEKACHAMYIIIEADHKNIPLSKISVSDEEIQSVIRVVELSRGNGDETSKYISAVFGGSLGVVDPAAAKKYELMEVLGYMLSDVAKQAKEHVGRLVKQMSTAKTKDRVELKAK